MTPSATIGGFRRRAVTLPVELVQLEDLDGLALPRVYRATGPNLHPIEWARSNRDSIEHQLIQHGAILFRGFDLPDASSFRSFVEAISPSLLDYCERAAPRKEKLANVYSSTEFPPQYPIPMHHELAYAHRWPMKIWFYCATPSPVGGATPIADDRTFLTLLPYEIREKFVTKGVMYVRNYGPALDMPWQDAFQTNERALVEQYCRESGLEWVWLGDGQLRTARRTSAMKDHPVTGQPLWFNHAHLFHISNVEPELRDQLVAMVSPEDYPRNAFYGDGEEIERDVLDQIRDAYNRASVRFDWQPGDVMLLDNMAITHGRESFSGPRSILVSMTDPCSAA